MGVCCCAGGEGRAGEADSHRQGARRGARSPSECSTLSPADLHKATPSALCGAFDDVFALLSLQAESATLIGQAIQQNPAFLTLRKIEVSQGHRENDYSAQLLQLPLTHDIRCSASLTGISLVACLQAAREIAGTMASANNRVLLNSESLLLNLVNSCNIHIHALAGVALTADWHSHHIFGSKAYC